LGRGEAYGHSRGRVMDEVRILWSGVGSGEGRTHDGRKKAPTGRRADSPSADSPSAEHPPLGEQPLDLLHDHGPRRAAPRRSFGTSSRREAPRGQWSSGFHLCYSEIPGPFIERKTFRRYLRVHKKTTPLKTSGLSMLLYKMVFGSNKSGAL